MTPNIFQNHNHQDCSQGSMELARSRARTHGLRLTPIRTRVLEILLESHLALGAYDILARLKQEGLGSQPPVVYRALDFLLRNGFAHRLEKLNAYTACLHYSGDHQPMFLICETCKTVAEVPLQRSWQEIDEVTKAMGFKASSQVVEVIGLCPECAEVAQV